MMLAVPASAQRSSDDQNRDSSDSSQSRNDERSSRNSQNRSSRDDQDYSQGDQDRSARSSRQDRSRSSNQDRNQSAARDEASEEGVRGFIQRHDRDGDGYLSRNELPNDMQQDFESLDRDHDGYLSRKELQKHAQEAQRMAAMPIDVTYVWVIDANAGNLDVKDLQDAYNALQKIDKNNDGKISQQELRDRREHVVSQWCDRCFNALDTNGDGELSQEEAQDSSFGEEFDKFDRNRDGALTKSEIHHELEKEFESQNAQRSENQDQRRR